MKLKYLFATLLFLWPFCAFSQTYFTENPGQGFRAAVHFYPLQYGEIRLGLELPGKGKNSREFSPSFIYRNFYNTGLFIVEDRAVTGLGFRFTQRRYNNTLDDGPRGFYRDFMISYRGIIREFGVANSQGTAAVYYPTYLNVLSLQYLRGKTIRLGDTSLAFRIEGGVGFRIKHFYKPSALDNSVPNQVLGQQFLRTEHHTFYFSPSLHFNIPISYIAMKSIM